MKTKMEMEMEIETVSFGDGKEIIIQMFDWSSHQRKDFQHKLYHELMVFFESNEKFPFTTVWMPPPWRDAYYGNGHRGSGFGWMDFKKNSAYGTDEDLKRLSKIIHKKNIKIIYDVVINHRNDSKDHELEANVDKIWRLIGPKQWADINSKKKQNLGVDFGGQLNLETNSEVIDIFANEFLNLIVNYHADGFLFDYARGYHPETIKNIMDKVKEKLYGNKKFSHKFLLIAEYTDIDKSTLKKYSDISECAMLDFNLFEKLRSENFTFTNNSILESLDRKEEDPSSKAFISFVGNHDSDREDKACIHLMQSLPDLKCQDFCGDYIYIDKNLYYVNDRQQAENIFIHDEKKFTSDLVAIVGDRLVKNLSSFEVDILVNSNSSYNGKKFLSSVPKWLRKSAYTYILLTPGTPCVFWPHWQEINDSYNSNLKLLINQLIYIRQALGIHAGSELNFFNSVSTEGLLVTIYGDYGAVTLGLGEKIEQHPSFPRQLVYFSPGAGFLCFHDIKKAEEIMAGFQPSCFNIFSTN